MGLRPQYYALQPELDELAMTPAKQQQIQICEDYEAFKLDCRRKGLPIPKVSVIAGILCEKYGLTPGQTHRRIVVGQSLKKKLKEREKITT